MFQRGFAESLIDKNQFAKSPRCDGKKSIVLMIK